MKKLPSNWKLTTLGQVAQWGSGGTPDRSNQKFYGGSIPWFKTGELNDGVVKESEEFLTEEGLKNSSAKLFPKGSIMIAMYGATIGRCAILGVDGTTNQACAVAQVREGINSKYLFHYLRSQKQKFIEKGKGGAQPNISQSIIKEHPFPLAPLQEQISIAKKLDTLFFHIELVQNRLEKIPEILKQFRQAVLTKAITGNLTEAWRSNKPPDKWTFELAQDCCEKVQSGGTPKGSGFDASGIPFLKVYNIVNQEIAFDYKPQFVSDEIQNTQLKKSIAFPGDVLMNIVGPPLGKVAIIPDDYPEWNLNQAITLFRPKKYLDNKFLYYFLCEGTSVQSVIKETRGVVGQINISLSQCRNFKIPIPPLEEQHEIVKQIETLFSSIHHIESLYNLLKKRIGDIPIATLSNAFEGKLNDVSSKNNRIDK